jgi:pyruvate dehydrogenase E1 component alpha subunit
MTTAERVPLTLDRAHAMQLLGQMLRIRRFEEKCAELYGAGRIRGFLHLYIGEEAVAVGAMQALTGDDAIVATYREHGHALARGVDARRLMAEMYGKQEGCSRGRGGSMHVFDASARFYGGNAIVGGGLPIAVGLALADALLARRSVTACFFGDGAVAALKFTITAPVRSARQNSPSTNAVRDWTRISVGQPSSTFARVRRAYV